MPHNTLLSPLLHALATPMDHLARVWQVDLQAAEPCVPLLLPALPAAEQARANGMKHQGTRHAFIAMRAALRHLLASHYLNEPAADIRIMLTDQGKPVLPDHGTLYFNVSHSHDYGVIGISSQMDIGVDIEKCNAKRSLQGIVDQFFSTPEQACFQQYPTAETFYRIWTGKEAVLKAWGTGLSQHMDKIATLPTDDREYVLQSALPQAAHTLLTPLPAPPGYAGAMALWQTDYQQ